MKTNLLKLTFPAVALMVAASANAVPTLTITDGAGNTASGSAMGPGTLFFNGAVGDWNLNILSALTFPALGSATVPHIDVGGQDNYLAGSFNAVGNTLGTPIVGGNVLTIVFTADGFGPVTGSVLANIGGNQNGTLTYVTKANGTVLTSSGTVGSGAYSSTETASLSDFNGNLQEVITLTATGSSDFVSMDGALELVPDSGMTLVLLGSSLTALALFARTRKVVA